MSFWKNKNVLITGGAGFIGSHLTEMLLDKGAIITIADNSSEAVKNNLEAVRDSIMIASVDLYDYANCLNVTKGMDVVMNLAAKVAGVEYNSKNHAEMFFDNIRLGTNVLEAARVNKIKRILMVSTACVYTRNCIIPTPEIEGMRYIPEDSNEGYGWAKRMIEAQSQDYAKNYGMEIAIARPYNAYGPRDHFEPERSHVIAALIKRIFDGEDPLIVWGNGEQSRAFIFVEDFARGLIELTEKYPCADPVNIGTDEEIKIKDLVKLILKISGKNPRIVFDETRPSGQPRRNSDNTKAKDKIGFSAQVSLEDGLKKTIAWYIKNKHK